MLWEHPEFPGQQFSLVLRPPDRADIEATVGAESVLVPVALQEHVIAMTDAEL